MADAHPDYSRLAKLVEGLGLHQHLCLIYDTREEQLAAALPFFRTGLERGEKCLYFADEKTAAAVLNALRKIGTDVDQYLRSGALTVTHKRETDLQQERFDPDWWNNFLIQETAKADAVGFPALRILGDLDWPLQGSHSTDKLIEYESRINIFVRDHDARVICQYNRKVNEPEFVLGIIRTHPVVVHSGLVCKNPYYVPPDEFLKPNQPALEVERLLKNILAWERAQQALRNSEEHLRLVIDTVPALIHSGRPDGYLDFFNKRWLDYVGLSLEQISGWKWTAVIHPGDVAAEEEKWRAALRKGEPFENEARVQRADGEYRWMIHRKVPLRDEQGNIVKWYGSGIDIEDRKRAEVQWRALIDAIPQQIWSGPPDGTNDFVNDRWRSDMGLGLEDLQGDGWQTMLHPEDRDRVLKTWHESVLNGMPYEQEERHRRADGTFRWYLNRGVPLRNSEGRIIRWYGTNTDIEDRKRAEDDLKGQKEILQKIFDNVPAMIGFVGPDGKIKLANREWERTLGWTLQEVHEQDLDLFAQLYPDPEYRQEVLDFVFKSNGQFSNFKTRVRDGRVIDTSWANVHLADGTTIGIGRDITDRKRAEESLRESEERFRALFQGVQVGVVVSGPHAEVLSSNPAARDLLGVTEEQLLGTTPFDPKWKTFYEDGTPCPGPEHPIPRAISTRQPVPNMVLGVDRPARGDRIWLLVSAQPQFAPGGAVKNVICTFEDITERKLAEGSLRESEERFRSLVQSATVGIYRTTPQGRILMANPTLVAMLGYGSIGELADRNLEEDGFEPGYSRQVFRERIEREGELKGLEAAWTKRDGSVIFVRESAHAVRGESGRVLYYDGIVEDITERKLAEEELRESEERFRSIFENAGLGTSLVDAKGRPIKCNPAIQKMLGYSEEELRNMSFTEFTYPDDLATDWGLYQDLLAGKLGKYEIEKRWIKKDGQIMWGHLTVSAVMDKNGGRVLCTIGMVEDITERKRAEEALRESEERFRTTFETAGVGMALVDTQGHPVKSNPALQRMLGYSSAELAGMSFVEFTHPDDRELDQNLYSDLMAGKRDRYEIEKRYIKKEGQVMWGQLIVSLVRGADATPTYAIGMVEDITERKRAEEELQRSRDQLRALAARLQKVREEERTKVAREIHDELGQALTAIKIDLSSLARELPANQKQQSQKTSSILKLVDETIESVRRIATDLRPGILDDLGLVATIEWVGEEFEARTGTKCSLDLPPDDLDIDQEKATAIFRILQEALTNVVRHSDASTVEVRLAKENNDLVLEVFDNGKGIPADKLSNVGSLGILGMRERAMLLGGDLAIDGVPGRGTKVRVRIPHAVGGSQE